MISEIHSMEYYKALVEKNPEYERVFYAGVKTTGVFCRSTCPANKPKFENCEFFSTAKEALYASYRCCKRCKPLFHVELTPPAGALLEAVEAEPQKLWKIHDFETLFPNAVAMESCFKDRFGMTFIEYARARRIGLAMKHIRAGYISHHGSKDAFSEFMQPISILEGRSLKATWLTTVLGPMIAIADDKGLYLLEFVDRKGLETEVKNLRKKMKAAIIPGRNKIIDHIELELVEYFNGKKARFETPLHWIGSDFQKSVWSQLVQIPIGETRTYLDLAVALGKPNASRAVGRANGNNPLALVVPCHRVINTGGDLGGYGGGLIRKQKLLVLEKEIAKAHDLKQLTRPVVLLSNPLVSPIPFAAQASLLEGKVTSQPQDAQVFTTTPLKRLLTDKNNPELEGKSKRDRLF